MSAQTRLISWFSIFLLIGCSVFLSLTKSFATVVGGFEEITTERGFGSGLNKYSWSSTTFSVDDNIYIATFNVNLDTKALGPYANQISAAPNPGAAQIDAFRRLWSGSPATPSTGGEIWQYNTSTSTWKQVLKADSEDVGFRKMTEYEHTAGAHSGKKFIYAGTANGPNGPEPTDLTYKALPPTPFPGSDDNTVVYHNAGDDKTAGTALYRSADGENWTEVSGGPNDNPYNSSNRAMAVIDGKLWVGTENVITGPELWSYDGENWNLEYKLSQPGPLPGGVAAGLAIGEVAEHEGQVYMGTWGSGGGFQLLKLENTTDPITVRTAQDVTPVFSDSSIVDGNSGVMQLYEYTGNDGVERFYLGTVNYSEGFTFLRTENPMNTATDSWQLITQDGFESEGFPGGTHFNAYTWSTQIIDGVTYLGTFNLNTVDSWIDQLVGIDIPLDGRGQIWYTEDGLDWYILEDNGFDSKFTYGFRTMTEWDDRLVVGSASNMFFPDLFSMPYADYTFDVFYMILGDLGIEMSMEEAEAMYAKLLELELDHSDFLPYIGTQVFMSERPIPEPATMLLVGTGLVGLAGFRRKFKK